MADDLEKTEVHLMKYGKGTHPFAYAGRCGTEGKLEELSSVLPIHYLLFTIPLRPEVSHG